jgi:predicted hotdog family 3-hydroxylacyl-ACP dehydratase
MGLSKAEFAALIPHTGAMNLLDRVVDYDAEILHAVTGSHRSEQNPLRRDGRLSAATGIEFAAQAMAIHGALIAGDSSARPGYLALAREIRWTTQYLDDVMDDLDIRVQRLLVQTDSAMYGFFLTVGEQMLVEGRAAVFFPRSSEP